MLGGEGRVKGLDAQRRGIAGEAFRGHERNGAKAADVTIVNRAAVVQAELYRRVRTLALRQVPVIDEERAGEAGLHDESVSTREIEHDELGAPPATLDDRADNAMLQLAR